MSSSYMIKMFGQKISLIRHFEILGGNIVKKEGKTYIMISLLKKKEVHIKKEGSTYISLSLKKKVFFCLRRKNIPS